MVGSPILFQSYKSILVGAPGWWFMRLYHLLESHGGGFGELRFRVASAVWSGETEAMRTMNRAPRVSIVIFAFFGVQFVSWGVYCAPI
jgi:hypothetical protein